MERFYFYDSTDAEQRIYQAADFARFHGQIVGNGVTNTPNLADLSVEPKQNMTVILGAGFMFANGYMYENTSALDLVHDVAEPDIDRIDRVVIRFDNNPAERKVYAYIKKGIPGAAPPEIVRDGYVFEMSVAQVRIIAGKSYIEAPEITDERVDDEVCGYTLLHNIYRGIEVDEHGMTSMRNQSFVKAYKYQAGFNIPYNQRTTVPFAGVVEDNQSEVDVDEHAFVPKTSGVFHVWAEVGFPAGSFGDGTDVHLYVYVNGEESFPIAATSLSKSNDNFILGSGVDKWEEGDKVQIMIVHWNQDGQAALDSHLIRLRIAKIS